ncbi:MAG TPA: GvpL/GvpF family gas vesicle protein [Candidatus Nitrosotalea sp.]|nr:GvpL/GvpF family gas vesicle protein [Candidatus Nitrosotalea sp.]
MNNGKYLYCIVEDGQKCCFNDLGLLGKPAYTVIYKDVSAVVSNVPFKEIHPDAESITAHQKIIEASRIQGTTLPARFGIMFKSDEGVKQMLIKSYKDLKSKIIRLRGMDEFGLKIIIDEDSFKKFSAVSQNKPEIKKIKKEIQSSGDGTGYFLKMKMDEAIRNETHRRIEQISKDIHDELAKTVQQNCLLRSDFDQIVLNAAYLIDRNSVTKFHKKLDTLKDKYKEGLLFHLSGPWAPYSFC